MMTEPLENLYFNWLCNKIISNENPTPSLTYWRLLRTLHNTEFVWTLSGDDNRAEEGLELRLEFLVQADISDRPEWRRNPGCSVLEMFVAFSRRTAYVTDPSAKEWFWLFIENLGLIKYNDAVFKDEHVLIVADKLDRFIWRTYGSNGYLFPLKKPKDDQRTVELWYQFSYYETEQDRYS